MRDYAASKKRAAQIFENWGARDRLILAGAELFTQL
jgi:hypothetical protein